MSRSLSTDARRQSIASKGGGVARSGAGRAPSRTSLASLLLLVILTPDEMALNLGPVLITPVRLALFLMLPVAVIYTVRIIPRLTSFDVAYLLFSLWTCFCIIIHYDIAVGIQRAGQFFMETFLIYVIVQGSVNTYEKFERYISIFIFSISVLLVLAIIEQVAGYPIHVNFLRQVFGGTLLERSIGERLGLIRVTTIFPHPILFGLFCASALSYAVYSSKSNMGALIRSAIISGATFFSLSSGPLLVLVVQYAMIIGEVVSRGVKRRALIFFAGLASFLTLVQIVASRGIFALALLFVFSQQTAYYRRDIWDFGVRNVARNPIFGMRPEDWERAHWMTPSIDNYWLFQAMQGGLPSVVLLLSAITLIMWKAFSRPVPHTPIQLANLRRGWAYSIAAMALCGVTVHFYGKLQPFFALQIAMGGAVVRLIMDWEAATQSQNDLRSAATDGEASSRPRTAL